MPPSLKLELSNRLQIFSRLTILQTMRFFCCIPNSLVSPRRLHAVWVVDVLIGQKSSSIIFYFLFVSYDFFYV